MNKIKIVLIILVLVICLCGEKTAGGYSTEQAIKIEQSKFNIYIEVGKWGGGIITVGFASWFTWYLNNKRKKND